MLDSTDGYEFTNDTVLAIKKVCENLNESSQWEFQLPKEFSVLINSVIEPLSVCFTPFRLYPSKPLSRRTTLAYRDCSASKWHRYSFIND